EPGQILTPAPLRKAEPRARAIAPVEEFTKVVKAKLGHEFKLPAAFLEGGRIVGGELLDWRDESHVPQAIITYGDPPDREVALYEISCCHTKCSELTQLMASLHPVETDPDRQFSISACKGCDAVLVMKGSRTYLLISRHGRDWDDDWLVERAR